MNWFKKLLGTAAGGDLNPAMSVSDVISKNHIVWVKGRHNEWLSYYPKSEVVALQERVRQLEADKADLLAVNQILRANCAPTNGGAT